jgi:hypothetical protein
MTAPTRSELMTAALNAASTYPTLGALIQAGDPLVLAQIGAQAAMLEMVAGQAETAQFEPFLKARDSTILADAALKGILPLGRAGRRTLSIYNPGPGTFTLQAGRRFQDSAGRYYVADTGLSVAAGVTSTLDVTQKTTRTVTHTVGIASAFYKIQIPFEDEGAHLNTLEVWKDGAMFDYVPEWFNVGAGDTAYQVEVDELRRMWVCFGSKDVVGYAVQAGDVFELRLSECEGRITDLTAGSTFTLEYTYETVDGLIKASLSATLDEGANPLTMGELRVMSQYPALYDHSAVYLGQFGSMLRRYLTPIVFLSVWNEQVEEAVRGASVNNINTLFVSGSVDGMSNTAFESRVRALIARADDSYKVKFVAQVESPVPVTVACRVSVVHEAASVIAQVKAVLLEAYGREQTAVSQGMSNPLREQAIVEKLKDSVPALQDSQSDFKVTITLPTAKPENYLHLTDASITVTVDRVTTGNGLWGY